MCDPFTLAVMAAGTAASVAGSGIAAGEDARNAQRIADARNKVLRETEARNKVLSDAARAQFDKRVTDAGPETTQPQMAQQQADRSAGIQANLDSAPPPDTTAPVNAPKVVQSTLAKKMAEVGEAGRESAMRLGKLGGYGDFFQDQAIQTENAGRGVDTNLNFIRGNYGLMPALQDYAEIKASRPSSGLGQILQALGSAASMYAGSQSGGGFYKKPAGPNLNLKGPGGTLGGGV